MKAIKSTLMAAGFALVLVAPTALKPEEIAFLSVVAFIFIT
jgi:hypothetical protein